MAIEDILQWTLAVLIVLIIIVFLLCKTSLCQKQVQFVSDDVMSFCKDDPPNFCNPKMKPPRKRDTLLDFKVACPATFRHMADQTLPDATYAYGPDLSNVPTLEDEISGKVPLKHKPYTGACVSSHVEFDGFNTEYGDPFVTRYGR